MRAGMRWRGWLGAGLCAASVLLASLAEAQAPGGSPPDPRALMLKMAELLGNTPRWSVTVRDNYDTVQIHVGSEIAALEGDCQTGLTGVVFRDRKDGSTERCAVRYLFLFIGADPNARWLVGCVETDDKGFVLTGKGPLALETTRPGVFAIGDVRSGSVKRVAAGVGEGAAVVAQIHQALAAQVS